MKAYIAISYSKRKDLQEELDAIIETLNQFKITAWLFTDNYQFSQSQEREMMQQAMNDINDCDMLIAEVSDKAIGVGIELGYAKAKAKPVIYLRQKNSAHSTTASGISDFQIIYLDANDLQKQLAALLEKSG